MSKQLIQMCLDGNFSIERLAANISGIHGGTEMLTNRGLGPEGSRGVAALIAATILAAAGCSRGVSAAGTMPENSVPTVGVAPVAVQPIARQLTVSSELVPFQEIDVYAKESGFVRDLRVDYGSRVKQGDLMAVLEIPELETQLARDAAAIKQAADQITLAENEVKRVKAQRDVAHLQYTRLKERVRQPARPGGATGSG